MAKWYQWFNGINGQWYQCLMVSMVTWYQWLNDINGYIVSMAK